MLNMAGALGQKGLEGQSCMWCCYSRGGNVSCLDVLAPGQRFLQDGKVLIQMLIDVQLTPRQRSFFNLAIRRDPAAIHKFV